MKLLERTKSEITKDKNGEYVVNYEIAEVVLVHCHIVNNNYQQDSRVSNTFIANKSFGQLPNISPKNSKFLKTFHSEFSCTEVWFTDQNSKPLQMEDKINIALIIN